MHKSQVLTQEGGRTAQVNVKLTPSEKEAVRLVAAFDRVSESEALRRQIPQVVERAREIRSRAASAA